MYKIEDFLGLKILEVEDESLNVIKKLLNKEDYDLANILSPTVKMLKKFPDFIYRPRKITYVLDVPKNAKEYLASLNRNKRKRMLRAVREFGGFELVKEEQLKKESFLEWFEIYKKNITSKEKGRPFIREGWFQKHGEKMCGIFFKQDGRIIGGILLTKKKSARLSVSFSSSKKKFYSQGINDFLNFQAILFAHELGYEQMERGMDNNLYGYHLSPGLYLFKKSLGFRVEPKEKYGKMLTKIENFDKFSDIIFIIGYKNKDLMGYLFRKDKNIDPEGFNSGFLKDFKVIDL